MFTKKDIKDIEKKGLTLKAVENQIANFKNGFPFVNLVSPAEINNGILKFSKKETSELAAFFDENFTDFRIIKFVPSSGAASRMFKNLLAFKDEYDETNLAIENYINDKSFNSPFYFFQNIKKFAFYDKLKKLLLIERLDIDHLCSNLNFKIILDYFLTEKGMNYAAKPKGLLLFHNYKDSPRLAVEEHLVEGAHYSTDKNGISRIHFTVSPEHLDHFKVAINQKLEKYELKYDVRFEITFSIQKSFTDTIAVDLNNYPFRDIDGSLIFRPGGHGALIENLNDLNGDIIFIKNIDNVVPDRLKGKTYIYKKLIAGLLIKLQKHCFEFLEKLDNGNIPNKYLDQIKTFAEKELNIFFPRAYEGYEQIEKIDFIYTKLNRPIRVCGMVKNEGEPGGGPFWVINENEENCLRIVESSQIDFENKMQKEIASRSTHFNPVDIVCSVIDFKGKRFNLIDYIDHKTGFISYKSKDGRELKALELPGLWNGAMADWITIFVETPLITFNPVKTINDLLRPQHQPK